MAKPSKSTKEKKPAIKTARRRRSATKANPATGSTTKNSLRIANTQPVSVNPPKAITKTSLTVAAGAAPEVQTIIYIHGIGNKPLASVLKCQWDSALFNVQLGDRSRMAYWVNRDYYPVPSDETCAGGDLVQVDDDEATTRAIMAQAAGRPTNEQEAIENEITALTEDKARQEWLRLLANKMVAKALADEETIKKRIRETTGRGVPRYYRCLSFSGV